jgi:hypothetical protein
MRGFTVALAVVMLSAMAVGQAGLRGVAGYCPTGCGPYIPLITTPSVSFETVSPSPVGATNATGGLHAGARNSTLSLVTGNTDAVHTQVVWYEGGGSSLVAPAVRLPLAGSGFMRAQEEHMAHRTEMEHGHGEEARNTWTYYAGHAEKASLVTASTSAKSAPHAARTYTNADVERVGAKAEEFRKK